MKIKRDFVTNSSTTSYTISSNAQVVNKDIKVIVNFTDGEMKAVMEMLEEELRKLNLDDCDIIFNQEVTNFCCDGWDGGDYNFAGMGGLYLGQTELAAAVLEKENVLLEFKNGKLKYPKRWNHIGKNDIYTLLKGRGYKRVAKLLEIDEHFLRAAVQIDKEGMY